VLMSGHIWFSTSFGQDFVSNLRAAKNNGSFNIGKSSVFGKQGFAWLATARNSSITNGSFRKSVPTSAACVCFVAKIGQLLLGIGKDLTLIKDSNCYCFQTPLKRCFPRKGEMEKNTNHVRTRSGQNKRTTSIALILLGIICFANIAFVWKAVIAGQSRSEVVTNDILQIAPGEFHTCALMATHRAKCWGFNYYNQLGEGTIISRTTPVSVTVLTEGINAISGGGVHTCALTLAGGVKCWGWNSTGQLGDGTTITRVTPVDVAGLTNDVTAITTGWKHSCALTSFKGVKCWGWNEYGQLGDGTQITRTTPVDVVGLTTGVSAIAADEVHTCALTSNGGVKCWGLNDSGELGDGTTISRNIPVDVVGLTNGVSAIAVGQYQSCALTEAGAVKCWGWNYSGQLGNGTNVSSKLPVDVSGLASGVIAITAGMERACALTTSGGVKCWGRNYHGALGNGSSGNSSVPVDVNGLTNGVIAIAAGGAHTCALTQVYTLKCWGYNSFGQLGDGTFTDRFSPVDVLELDNVPSPTQTPKPSSTLIPSLACKLNAFGDSLGNPLNQKDPNWGTLPYGGYIDSASGKFVPFINRGIGKDQISDWGCYLTSAAMIVNYFARKQNVLFETTPKILNEWLQRHNGYSSGAAISNPDLVRTWREDPKNKDYPLAQLVGSLYTNSAQVKHTAVSLYAREQTRSLPNGPVEINPSGKIDGKNDSRVIESICSGNPVILNVKKTGFDHFVVASGSTTSSPPIVNLLLHDPLAASPIMLNPTWLGTYYSYNIYKGETIKPKVTVRVNIATVAMQTTAMQVGANQEAISQLLLTDSQGRKSGFDPQGGQVLDEIPGASYGIETLTSSDGVSTIAQNVLAVDEPLSGTYTLTVISNDAFAVEVENIDRMLSSQTTVLAKPASVNGSNNYHLQIIPDTGVSIADSQTIFLPIVRR